MGKLSIFFNSHNILHTLAAVVLCLGAAAGITTTDAGTFFGTSAALLATVKALGAFVLFRASDELKNGTLIDKLKEAGKLSWHKALSWLQSGVVAFGIGQGILQPDMLTNIHNVGWTTVVFALVTTFKTLYTHYMANVTTDTKDATVNAAASASK